MFDPSNAIATRNSCTRQDEINLINKELMEPQSHEERAALLQRLNSVQASTGTLPPEILSIIIQRAYRDIKQVAFAPSLTILKLGHVSSYWRQIVWSTPQLWSDLTIGVCKRNIHIVVPLLQLHLRNVGGLLLSVDLRFNLDSYGATEARGSFDLIASVLFREGSAAKIQSLCLAGAPWQWAAQIIMSSFSSLKHLSLTDFQGRHRDSEVLNLAKMLCLHDMRLSILDVQIELCWSKITKLDLWEMPIDTCVKLLTKCHHVVEFHCLDPVNPYDDTSTTFDQLQDTITLNYLEIFEWTHHWDPSYLEVLRLLRFPVLRELIWNNCRYDLPEEEEPPEELQEKELVIRTLTSNLPPTLSSLELRRLTWTIPLLRDVFNQTEHVEHLSVEAWAEDVTDNIFSVLIEDEDAGGHPMLLSSLEKVIISPLNYFDVNFESTYSLLILEFLQNRFRRGCSRFRLEIQEFLMLDWPPEVQEELCRMWKAGFDLEIYDKSGRLDWLEGAGSLAT